MDIDQGKLVDVINQARQENDETISYIKDHIIKPKLEIKKLGRTARTIASDLKELNFFKGRFLRHAYDQKVENKHDYDTEIREVVNAYKKAAPLNPYEQRKATKKRCASRQAALKKTAHIRTELKRKFKSK